MTPGEYRERRKALRPLIAAFRNGRLGIGGSGGAQGMLFIRMPDGSQWFVGGANDASVAHAIVEAVNFALDLCETPDGV